jgi:hypothetical protein
MVKNKNSPSQIFSILIIIFSLFIFSNANKDFSYDYSVYIYYFENIGLIDTRYILRSIGEYFPLPYVFIPPSATFEFGFVAISFLLTKFGFSSLAIYTIIATFSISIRAFVLSRFNISLLSNILITTSYITLFESNAMRVGVASSLLLISLLNLYQKNYITSIFFATLSCTFHIQSFIYILCFGSGLAVTFFSYDNKNRRAILSVILIVAVSFLIPTINVSSGTKIDDYLMRSSDTNGLNLLSGTSIIICLFCLYYISLQIKENISTITSVIWFSAFFAFAQATIFLIIGGAFADIGIRIWQFAFLFMFISTFLLKVENKNNYNDFIRTKRILFFVKLCCVFQSINVLYRYPLSNFFYPILQYNYIDYVKY